MFDHAETYEVTYTDAPEDYDGWGTVTINVLPRKSDRGVVRRVVTSTEHLEWQRQRYGSGMFLCVSPDTWDLVQEILTTPVAQEKKPISEADLDAVLQERGVVGDDETIKKLEALVRGALQYARLERGQLLKRIEGSEGSMSRLLDALVEFAGACGEGAVKCKRSGDYGAQDALEWVAEGIHQLAESKGMSPRCGEYEP